MDKLKKKRGIHRRNATVLIKKVEEYAETSTDESKKGQLEAYKTELMEMRESLKKMDEEVLEVMYEKEQDATIDKEMEEASVYKQKILITVSNIEDQLAKMTLRNSSNSSLMRSDSHESVLSATSNSSGTRVKVKLPKLEIRKFAGQIYEWQEFWDAFCSAVHHNEDLADVDKLKYLRGYLEGSARSVIAGVPTTESSYATAVELLQKRFANPNVIERSHTNQLINLPPVFGERNVSRLRQLLDQIEIHHRGLQTLGVDPATYSHFVVPFLMDKIPEQIRLSMIRFNPKDQLEWTIEDFVASLEKEIKVRENHNLFRHQTAPPMRRQPQQQQQQHNQIGTASAMLNVNKKRKCAFCLDEAHQAENCKKVEGVKERRDIAKRFAKCFICLNSGHKAINCRSRINCRICNGKHHVSICNSSTNSGPSSNKATDLPEIPSPAPSAPLDPNANSWTGNVTSGSNVALQTALAFVDEKKEEKVRVLFDSGSQKSFVTAKTVSKLGLNYVRKENLGIRAFGSNETDYALREIVNFSISPVNGGESVNVECFVVPEIASIVNEHVEFVKHDYPHLKRLYFSDVAKNKEDLEVDILVGANFIWQFQKGETIRGGPNDPVAIHTTLGWVLSGPLKGRSIVSDEPSVSNANLVSASTKQEKQLLEEKVSRLWDLDTLGIRPENEVHEKLIDEISFSGGRYTVGLPWKVGHGDLPSNYDVCFHRLQGLLRKLRKEPEILTKYDEIIKEQEQAGIIQKVANLEPEPSGKIHYLAHRAVIRDHAETTKVRIVFDASCKETRNGTSLNDCLHVGPPLTPLLFNILLRFRHNKVCLIGDIEKAFLNIGINEVDRDCLRFLWVSDTKADKPDVQVYRYNTAVFGVRSSPFLLNAVLRHHIESFKNVDPEFVFKLSESFYVDDLVTGCETTEETFCLYEKARDRLKLAAFSLRKWKSNDQELMARINAEERKIQGENEKQQDPSQEESFAKETLGTEGDTGNKTKVLGLAWDMGKDTLDIQLGKVSATDFDLPTKRKILSTLAGIFDPLGITSPVSVTGKVLFQEICVNKLGWDEPLPQELALKWQTWLKDLQQTGKIEIPRCYYEGVEGEILSYSLHGFGDASKKAYSAVVYLVCQTTKGVYTRLLTSKTRVAPLKSLSINRLELMSAKILTALMSTVKSALSSQIKIDSVRYWLDSKTSLYWILNRGEWKQFVQHRVNEILLATNKGEWGHVSGIENPADLGSRGMKASQIQDNNLWWEGPTWLKRGESKWPKSTTIEGSDSVNEEKKKVTVLSIRCEPVHKISSVIEIGRYCSLLKLLRVTALVLRFINNIKARKAGKNLCTGKLDAKEISEAEKLWLIDAQLSLQGQPDFSKTKENLGIVLQDQILVCKGRLENSDLSTEAKYPIILPKSHRLTELLVFECHKNVKHLKTAATLTEFRSRFWVTKGRQFVKKLLKQCFLCRKHDGKPYHEPPSAPLPKFRVSEAPPFTHVGVDFAGPLYTKGDQGMMNKCYIVLFSCCVTRALHLELIHDLTALNFIHVLRKFCARRGTPNLIVSDNAKTFKSTVKVLKKIHDNQQVQDFLVNKRIRWLFNLERASWWGGHFERMVGSVKRCLKKVLGSAKLSFIELEVVLFEVENTLNSRPLTYNHEELGEEPLTPSHLLHGRRLSHLSSGVYFESDFENHDKLSKRFSYLTLKLSHFWKRWRGEYLSGLRETHRLQDREPVEIKPGDIVLVGDENKKRGFWKMGIVDELIVGKDGHTRGAKVRMHGAGKPDYLNRPLQKLYPLELSVRNVNEEQEKIMESENSEVESGEKGLENSVETRHPGRKAPHRAAAQDARLRTQLMLDYV